MPATSQHQFAKASTFSSVREWQRADRYIVHAIKVLANKNDDSLLNLLQDLPSGEKAESTDERILRQQLITTRIPAFVDEIAKNSGLSADLLLKPVLRTLRAVASFATSDKDPLEQGLKAVILYIRGGRTGIFEGSSQPPGSNWPTPNHY